MLHFIRVFLGNPADMMKIMQGDKNGGEIANGSWQEVQIATFCQDLKQALCKQAVQNWIEWNMLDPDGDGNEGSSGDVKLLQGWHETDIIISDSESSTDL